MDVLEEMLDADVRSRASNGYAKGRVKFLTNDDEGNNAFHIVADTEKMVRENLEEFSLNIQGPLWRLKITGHSPSRKTL
ncbi:hypothetical protein Tco_0556813 [Tanacetum coccineum]